MKKILIIEDNADLRENISEILLLAGYEVVAAQDGKEGVALAVSELPDLIICDIAMPNLDGHGVIHLLSRKPETRSIPFIFLTAKAERADFRKGMELGADDYITKPFDDLELLNAIEMRLRKSQNKSDTSVQSSKSLDEILDKFPRQEYQKKSLVFKEGLRSKGVYYVNSGRIKLSMTNPQGKELITAVCVKDDFIGVAELMVGEYNSTGVVMEDSVLTFIPTDDFLNLVFGVESFAKRVFRGISAAMLDREDRLLQLAYDSVRRRVASALSQLYSKSGNLELTISREDLSQLAGTSTETVIRTLGDFQDENLLQLSRSSIRILEPEKLAEMKN